jgi:hypothetical protein
VLSRSAPPVARAVLLLMSFSVAFSEAPRALDSAHDVLQIGDAESPHGYNVRSAPMDLAMWSFK